MEILYSGTWSSIYDTSWTTSDATVVCRQLGHSIESTFRKLNFMVYKLTLKVEIGYILSLPLPMRSWNGLTSSTVYMEAKRVPHMHSWAPRLDKVAH